MRLSLPLALFSFLAPSAMVVAECYNRVSNGSFESGSIGPAFAKVPAGASNIDNWDVTTGEVDYINTYWQASDGSRSIDLNGEIPGAIATEVATEVGMEYVVKFDISGNTFAEPNVVKRVIMTLDGTEYQFTYDVVAMGNSFSNMKYVEKEVTFTATSAVTTIEFAGAPENKAWGIALDNVRMYPSCCKGGGCMGDPHFLAWNNQWYDFHGICDLVLLSAPGFSKGTGLDVHIRTKPRYEFSYIEAAAIKIGEDVLEIGSWGEYMVNGVDDVNLEGVKLGGKYTIHHEHHAEKQQHVYTIKTGVEEAIIVKTFKDLVSFNVENAGPANFETATGMMGDFEGLLLARDGVTIMDNHDLFGQEWQVNTDMEGELFQSPSPYKGQCAPPHSVTQSRRLGEATVSQDAAALACDKYGDEQKRDMCIFDVMAMADLEVADMHGVH